MRGAFCPAPRLEGSGRDVWQLAFLRSPLGDCRLGTQVERRGCGVLPDARLSSCFVWHQSCSNPPCKGRAQSAVTDRRISGAGAVVAPHGTVVRLPRPGHRRYLVTVESCIALCKAQTSATRGIGWRDSLTGVRKAAGRPRWIHTCIIHESVTPCLYNARARHESPIFLQTVLLYSYSVR